MNWIFLTFGVAARASRSWWSWARLAPSFAKTSTTTLPRIEFAVPVVACTIGMKTPSTSVVISTVRTAAMLGAALRESERKASLRKKPTRIVSLVRVAFDADAELAAQAHRELRGRLVGPVHAGDLVADQAPLVELDDAPAHLVDHLAVVGRDDDRRARAVDPVDQLHDPDRRLGIEVAGRLVRQEQRRMVH